MDGQKALKDEIGRLRYFLGAIKINLESNKVIQAYKLAEEALSQGLKLE